MFSIMLSSDCAGDSRVVHHGLGARRLLFDLIDSAFPGLFLEAAQRACGIIKPLFN